MTAPKTGDTWEDVLREAARVLQGEKHTTLSQRLELVADLKVLASEFTAAKRRSSLKKMADAARESTARISMTADELSHLTMRMTETMKRAAE